MPTTLQRAMAAEAEAAREARAKVIAAEGEMKSSKALKEAADTISGSPSALQVKRIFILVAPKSNVFKFIILYSYDICKHYAVFLLKRILP